MQRFAKGCAAGLILAALSTTGALAQPAGGAGGTGTGGGVVPAADLAPPKRLVIPPNFQKVTEGQFTVLCEPNEVAWVKEGLVDAVKKAKKPEGGPASMLDKLKTERAPLIKQITEDLALANDKGAADLVDTKVVPNLQKLDTIKVPIYYIVTSQDKFKALVQGGWNHADRFHYNKLTDAVAMNENLTLSTEKPMDDQVRVLFFDPKNVDPKKSSEGLSNLVVQQDAQIAVGIARQAFPTTFKIVSEWIDDTVFKTFKLPRNQKWVQLGIPAYLTTKYAARITGLPRDQYLAEFFQQKEDEPVSVMSVDLTNPVAEDSLNPALKPFYEMAMLKKSVILTKKIVDDSSDASIGKIIAALRKGVPADDAGLVKTIKDATGIDLAPKK
ncbi:MAG: hypothetical protein ACAI43_16750 [Phycisphaerae bacterium]